MNENIWSYGPLFLSQAQTVQISAEIFAWNKQCTSEFCFRLLGKMLVAVLVYDDCHYISSCWKVCFHLLEIQPSGWLYTSTILCYFKKTALASSLLPSYVFFCVVQLSSVISLAQQCYLMSVQVMEHIVLLITDFNCS